MNRYIIPVFLLVLSVGLYIQFIDPFYAAVLAGQSKIAEYDKLLVDAKTANDKLASLKEIRNGFPSGYETSLATMLPESIDPLRLVIDVNGIAALRGLHLKTPSVNEVDDVRKGNTGVKKSTLMFTVSAPYPIFRAFLRDLESDLALQDLSQLSFTSASSEGTSSNLPPELRIYDYQVTVTMYSLPK